MQLLKCSALLITASAASLSANAAVVTINDMTVTRNGVGGPNASAVTINGGATGTTVTADPINIQLTYSNLDLDGDASANDSVTFTLSAAGGGATQRIFDQGIDTGFGNLNDVTVSVTGVSGTTTDLGHNIVFDGFTGGTAGMGSSTAQTRSVEINGATVNLATTGGGFQFVQGEATFSPAASVLFDNSGGSDGSIVARAYDLQFSTVIPEPASFALLGLGGIALLGRRRSA